MEPNGNGTLNQFNRDNEHPVTIMPHQDAFSAVKGAAANPDALADFQERITLARNLACENDLNIIDLLFWDGNALPVRPDKPHDALGPQHSHAFFRLVDQAYKGVPGKERKLHHLPPVAPLS